ncbi:MAG: CoA-binding protein [Thermoleophilia bacterium]
MDPSRLAGQARVIAVVGASPDPSRPSFGVMKALIDREFDVIPVRPGCESILGRPCVSSLSEIEVPIDIVDVFRRSDAAADVARQAADVGARALWLQEGVVSAEAREIAREVGMDYVEDLCIKKVLPPQKE